VATSNNLTEILKFSSKSKRSRCKNFTADEEVELIALVRANQHVLKNKKSDAVTWKQKSLGWEKLAVDFSSKTGSKRTVHSAVFIYVPHSAYMSDQVPYSGYVSHSVIALLKYRNCPYMSVYSKHKAYWEIEKSALRHFLV